MTELGTTMFPYILKKADIVFDAWNLCRTSSGDEVTPAPQTHPTHPSSILGGLNAYAQAILAAHFKANDLRNEELGVLR
jgi:hypothetical protein